MPPHATPPPDGVGGAPLESVLRTEELNRRPVRPPNYAAENHALAKLIQALADCPHAILQTLSDAILELFQAGSAGISLLAKDESQFYWPAITGAWSVHIGGGTPRDFGPCGDVLDCNGPLLFNRLGRRYPYFQAVQPAVEEALLVPFFIAGKAVGTIWVVTHDDRRLFDAEDLRLLESLGRFASAAYRVVESTEDVVQTHRAMEAAHENLRAGEERYRTLFDISPVAVYSIDSSGVIQEFNPQAATLWGRTPVPGDTDERFCGSFKLYRSDGTFMPHDQCPMAEIVSGKISELLDAEVHIERLDGSRITVIVNIRPLKNGRGEVAGAINCFYEITERKRAEEALRAGEAFNRSIIASSPDCIKVLDLDGNLLSMECGFDLLGIDDIRPYLNNSWIDFWQGDDRKAARAAVESAREKAGATGNFVGFFKTLRDEPKWWDVTLSPILNAAGQPAQLLAVSRDVTQQTNDAEALRETEVRMRFASDTARLTYVEVDLATGVAKLAENFAAVMGYSISHELTANFHVGSELLLDHIAQEDRPRVEAALQEFLAGKTVGSIEYRVIGDDRIERWIESRWSIECDPDGKPIKTFAINLDITDRKRAEAGLRESQRFLRSSLDALSGHIAVLDEEGTILEVNKAWRRFADENHFVATNYGIGSSYLLSEVPTDPDECNVVTSGEEIRDVIAGRLARFELEYPCHSPTEERWYQMRVTRFDSSGPIRVVVVHDNITERKRAEMLLRQNNATFSQLIETAPFGLYVVDSDFKLRQVSSASKKVFQNIHPLIGRDFDEVLRLVWAEPFASEALGRFRHTLATGEPYVAQNSTELRYASIDIESYDWKIERVTLPDGRFGVVCYFYDISERINSELALRASEEQYRTLFDSMDEGYCIIEMIFDEREKPIDWRFLEVNPSFEKQTGLHNSVGKRMRSLVPDHEDYWFETYGTVVRTGEPVRFVNQAKGLENRWFDLYAFRVGEPGSHKVAVLFTDISERKRYEEAIRRSEQSLKFILASMPQMITTAKPNGEIDSYNPQWLEYTGLTIERMRGWGWKEIIHPDDLEETMRLWAHAVATGETYHRQERFRRADGEYRWHLSRAVPMKDADGEVVMWIGSNTDVHDIKEIENQLHEQSTALADLHRRKDEFLAMLSHELRSPLAPISNAVHLLRLQSHEEPLQRQARSVIERQVGQLSRLVDDLMEVSRITTGRVHLRQERVVVGGIVERAVETAYPMMEHRRHQLTVTVPPEPIWLFADSGRLEQVVVNLLTNAAKYTEVGGQVWVTVEPADSLDQCVLRVRDTGVGIAPGLLPRVFDLFTQAERSLDRSQGGLGIGLALVQRLVEMHGGTVEVTSALGQGSEFIVRLPLLKEDGKMRKFEIDALDSTGAAAAPLKVLVVDDNEDSAESLAMLLQVCGHDVRLAHDGFRALEEASDYRPDVILLDIGLPKMDGYEVAVKLRQQPAHQTCVLVALTGYGQESDRQRSLDAGFNHHLVKPADFTKLQEILAEASHHK